MRYTKISTIFWLALAILIGFSICGYAFWANYGLLPGRIERLEKEFTVLKADTLTSHSIDLQRIDFKIDKTEQSIRGDFDWLIRFGLPLTLVAFAGLFYSIYKSALGFALKKAEETINQYYLPDEERFKREKKLLVLTKEGGDSGFVRNLLQDTGFLAAATIPDNVKDLDEATLLKILDGNIYDVIFLNNENAAFDDREIKICHGRTPDYTMIFSFAKNLPTDIVASQRTASANFKSQIYANLINVLKYQQFLRKPTSQQQV